MKQQDLGLCRIGLSGWQLATLSSNNNADGYIHSAKMMRGHCRGCDTQLSNGAGITRI